ncbi:hypothetical protein AKJ16_DCAP14325 [Drosera capensis]
MPRESEPSRRLHSKSAPQDPRSKRDGKPEMEKSPNKANAGAGSKEVDEKWLHRLPDSSPREPRRETGFDKKTERHGERARDCDIDVAPRSRSYYQRDERGNAGQDGRSSRFRTADRGSWRDSEDELKRDSKDKHRTGGKSSTTDLRGRHEKTKVQGDDHRVWRHDKFNDGESELPQAKKRRPFREEKLPNEPESTDKTVVHPNVPAQTEHPTEGNERKEERRGHVADRSERDRAYRGQRPFETRGRYERERTSNAYGNRYSSGGGGAANGRYRGQDSYGGRQSYNSNGGNVEKWKHDLFHEANRSPTPKEEEDPIAKVEALLAS